MHYRVYERRERYAAQQDQQVTQCQAEYVDVGHVDHVLVPEEYQYQRTIADGSHEEYEREQHRDDVRFRSFRIIVLVNGVVECAIIVAAVVVHASCLGPSGQLFKPTAIVSKTGCVRLGLLLARTCNMPVRNITHLRYTSS